MTVPFSEAVRVWARVAALSFGGPAAQIAVMQRILVDEKRWIGQRRFLHALNYCMLLPGPEAQQLAIYVGWLLHRVRGGLVAGIAFVLPAFFLIMGLSWVYVAHGDVPVIAGVFAGLQAAVVGIVTAALIRIGRRATHNGALLALAAAAFLAFFVVHVPFPYIVLAAGVLGFVGGRVWPDLFVLKQEGDAEGATAIRDEGPVADHTRPTVARSIRVLVIGVAVWIVPLALVSLAPGTPEVIGDQAVFFSKAAMVTFGGAYAVLAYINQAAVQQYGWLMPGQMVTGLGLAESTPGPLIMVTEFVGFVAAYQNPGGMDPALAGVVGATVATWATFAPCFLWIFLGAPYIERLRDNRALTSTLSVVTAAVVGVILNLSVTFGIQTLFDRVRTVEVLGGPVPVPVLSSIDWFAAAVAVVSFVVLWRFRVNILWVIAASALAGLAMVLLS
ncbi:MAG: chromate efflux transporter [Actinomycetota bacterium]